MELKATNLALPLYDMEYRSVVVRGEYDHSQQVLLKNQAYDNQIGYHLLTPLIITGTDQAILVDRGWIPLDAGEQLEAFDEPGVVTVHGLLRRPQTQNDFGRLPDPTLAPGQTRLQAWSIVNVDRLQLQISDQLLPAYIAEAPSDAWTKMPYRQMAVPEISEGPHFGYAIQWFTFAAILALGYPVFVWRQINDTRSDTERAQVIKEWKEV
jgi:surfeit locus 1 family protein